MVECSGLQIRFSKEARRFESYPALQTKRKMMKKYVLYLNTDNMPQSHVETYSAAVERDIRNSGVLEAEDKLAVIAVRDTQPTLLTCIG